MQIKPIKYVIDILGSPLTHIFNVAFDSGTFPKPMQLAKVTVLHKRGDVNNLSNYRPMSILPVFSKGLEKKFIRD